MNKQFVIETMNEIKEFNKEKILSVYDDRKISIYDIENEDLDGEKEFEKFMKKMYENKFTKSKL